MHFNGRFILNLTHFAVKKGANFDSIIDLSGKTVEELSEEDCRLDVATYNHILKTIVEQVNDPLFGLYAGASLNLQAIGIVLHIAQASATVKQALERCCDYANLGCSALPLELIEADDYFKLTFTPDPTWSNQSPEEVFHTLLGVMAFSLRMYQSLTHHQYSPKEIWLNFHPKGQIEKMQAILGATIRFDQAENAILLHKEQLHQKVSTSDYALLQVLLEHADQKLALLEKEKKVIYNTVKQVVVANMYPTFPTIDQTAQQLGTSPRTLHRKLKIEGYTYKALIDQLKQEFALGYLKKPNLNISEIADLLGYSDVSTFNRSFKRWTGKTPSAFRKVLPL